MPTKRAPNYRLRALLIAAEWTEEQLARKVNEVAVENGERTRYDRTSVSRWLSGTIPQPRRQRFVAEALGRRLGRALMPSDLGWAGGGEGDIQETEDPLARLDILLRTDDTPAQPLLVDECVYQALKDVTSRSFSSPDAVSRAVPMDLPTQVLGAAVSFFAQAIERDGRHVQAALVAYVRHDILPREKFVGPSHSIRVSHTARLVHLLGRLSLDNDANGLAQRYYHLACDLAAMVGDATTFGTVLTAMSAQATLLGHRRHALELAERAVAVLPAHAPDGVRAYALSQLAVAQSGTGDTTLAHHTFAQAEKHQRSRFVDDASIPLEYRTFTEASLRYQKALMLMASGHRAAAVRQLIESLRLRPLGSGRAATLTHLCLIRLLLREGRVDEASIGYRHLLEKTDLPHSRRVARELSDVRNRFRSFSQTQSVRALMGPAVPASGTHASAVSPSQRDRDDRYRGKNPVQPTTDTSAKGGS
jgi:transcriptional regulator with XRE-family HTH domain